MEKAKIELSQSASAGIDLSEVERGFVAQTNPKILNDAIADQLGALTRTLKETLAASGLEGDRIDAVFLTGGSTAIPAVRKAVTGSTPGAKIIEGDMFGAVGLGLELDARRKFGSDMLRRSA